MTKYIQDSLRNNLRSIIKDLSKPQQKAVSEIARGLFTAGTPILTKLAQNNELTVKKQAEKYSHHLGNVFLKDKIDSFALRKSKSITKKETIIAYDLTDISKESAKKMDRIGRVFDGSKRKVTNGYTLHGVGINNILTKLEIHDNDSQTLNRTRFNIIKSISSKLGGKGIWIFDRGNDHKAFFKNLHHNLKLRFIIRLKGNRQVVLLKTGVKIMVKDLKPGKYKIYLMDRHNYRVDTRAIFTLVIKNHLEGKEPIRLISNLNYKKYSATKLVTMYLERWGIENIFKRVKTKFSLEAIRILNYQKFENLVSLIQFAVIVSTLIFYQLQQTTNTFIANVILLYKRFLKLKSLNSNLDSFISFLQNSLKPLTFHQPNPPNQPSLLPRRCLEKLGCF